jgi:GR25 family glycosyltransferase involved in LPS biosynthesis
MSFNINQEGLPEVKSKINDLVDNVYVLNLEKDLFKYNILKKKLDQKNIQHQRFVGIDGYDGSLQLTEKEKAFWKLVAEYRDSELYELVLKQGAETLFNGFGAFRSEGAMGCLLSHVKIFEDAVENKYDKILIFQDDIYFHNQFEELLEKRQWEIKRSAVFFLGATEHEDWMKTHDWIDPNWSREHLEYGHYWATTKTFGMFAVIVDKKVFAPFLKLVKVNFFADDQALALLAAKMFEGEGLVSYPNLVMADTGHSNTFDGVSRKDGVIHKDFEEHAMLMGWNPDYYDLSERYYA